MKSDFSDLSTVRLLFSFVYRSRPQLKSAIVSVIPKILLLRYLLKKMLRKNPETIIIPAHTRKVLSGLKYRPEITPAHRGRPIRRNGISL
jgi:hypothetical protein